jgi:hypothetical protein
MSEQFCVLCGICHEPVDLQSDATVTDEDGKAIHEHCYVKHIATPDAGQDAAT